MKTEEAYLPVVRLVDSTSVHIISMGAPDHTPHHHIEDLLMSTEVLPPVTIYPSLLSVLEDLSGTALIDTLMRLDLFATVGHSCQLLQKLPWVLQVAWEPTVQICKGTTTGVATLLKYGGGAALPGRAQNPALEIALVALKVATENLPLVLRSPPKRDQESCLRTDGGKERGKSPMLAGNHGTGARASHGAESESGIEAERGTAIGSVAERETAAEGRRGRDTGRQRESDTGIKTQTRGETGRETGTETETDLGIQTEGITTATEGETVTVIVIVIVTVSESESESETGDGTDPEAGIVIGTETVGKTGAGTETGRGIEIETGIGGTEAEAGKRERRKRTINMIPPRRVIKLQKMTRARHSLCFMDTTVRFFGDT